jgi:hypothetical protein
MLSTEQGVYIAESVAFTNTKQAKGRFRMYNDEDGLVHLVFFFCFLCCIPSEFCLVMSCSFKQDHAQSNHSMKRDQPSREAAGTGKKDTGKATKKAGKCSTSIGLKFVFF